MPELNTWNILTAIALLSLFIEFKMGRKAAAWGGLIVGVLIGMVWGVDFPICRRRLAMEVFTAWYSDWGIIRSYCTNISKTQ